MRKDWKQNFFDPDESATIVGFEVASLARALDIQPNMGFRFVHELFKTSPKDDEEILNLIIAAFNMAEFNTNTQLVNIVSETRMCVVAMREWGESEENIDEAVKLFISCASLKNPEHNPVILQNL